MASAERLKNTKTIILLLLLSFHGSSLLSSCPKRDRSGEKNGRRRRRSLSFSPGHLSQRWGRGRGQATPFPPSIQDAPNCVEPWNRKDGFSPPPHPVHHMVLPSVAALLLPPSQWLIDGFKVGARKEEDAPHSSSFFFGGSVRTADGGADGRLGI